MPVPPKDLVQPILDKIREPLLTVILGAWNDWRESPHVGIWRCKRSRANFVWEQIIDRAHVAFGDQSDVRILDGHETFQFLVEDRVLFRFKKGDEAGLTANVPTQLALAFHDHEQDLLGLPDVHRVEVVYQLNQLETEILDVIVVARHEEQLVWSYSLLDAGDGVVPLPVPEDDGELEVRHIRQLVRPRKASETRDRKKQD